MSNVGVLWGPRFPGKLAHHARRHRTAFYTFEEDIQQAKPLMPADVTEGGGEDGGKKQ